MVVKRDMIKYTSHEIGIKQWTLLFEQRQDILSLYEETKSLL